jgi:hypothetical protein
LQRFKDKGRIKQTSKYFFVDATHRWSRVCADQLVRAPFRSRSMIKSSPKHAGFEKDSHTRQSSIAWHEEAACMVVMGLWLGGPLVTFFGPIYLVLFGTTTQLCYFLAVVLVLALHPLPNLEDYLNKSAFSLWLYKYFSYRIMWSGDAYDKAQTSPPWVGAAGPHSVMPFGSVLSIPGINTFGQFQKVHCACSKPWTHLPLAVEGGGGGARAVEGGGGGGRGECVICMRERVEFAC